MLTFVANPKRNRNETKTKQAPTQYSFYSMIKAADKKTLDKWLPDGWADTIAGKFKVDPQYVRMIKRGDRENADIENALIKLAVRCHTKATVEAGKRKHLLNSLK